MSSVLVFRGPTGKRYEAKSDKLKGLEKNGGFSRVADGWMTPRQQLFKITCGLATACRKNRRSRRHQGHGHSRCADLS